MKMTETLANDLMDCLAALAISANGGCSFDENGEIIGITDEQLALVERYSRTTFEELCAAWEETMHDEWEVIPDGENDCLDCCEDYASENVVKEFEPGRYNYDEMAANP